jgi:hypothetical protein
MSCDEPVITPLSFLNRLATLDVHRNMKSRLVSLASLWFVFLAPVIAADAADWEVLFDGKPTARLRGFKKKEFPAANWVIENGALKTVPGRAVDLVSVDKYENFELEFEWKVAPGGNSGVMYNVAEIGSSPYETGPEYQVLDDSKHPDGRNPKTSSGSLYALIAPNAAKTLKPVGEFNSSKIVVKDRQVEHWLNGAKVVAYTWGSPEIKELIQKSKFKNMQHFMAHTSGHVDFQHHGEEAWYRNIRIRRL